MKWHELLYRIKNRLSSEVTHQKLRINKYYRKFYSEQHQLTSTTSEDRYPELFNEARFALQRIDQNRLKLLSYGCSTGEECFSLKKYFPESKIVGADINNFNLKTAAERNVSNDITFIYSNAENIRKEGKFHAIFCLSVLCRWEDTKYIDNCEKIYPFQKYQATVSMLAETLEPNGILVIYNSNFRFEETAAFADFEIVPTPSVESSGFVHKFDARNNKVSDPHKHCIYRKKVS